MKILIEATAAVSGGRVYLERLLPELARQAVGDEFIIFHAGELDGLSLKPVASRFAISRIAIAFPGRRFLILSGVYKLIWRMIVLPWHLYRLKPDLLFSNAGFAPLWKPASVKTLLALHNSMPLRAELIDEERSIIRRSRLRILGLLMGRALAVGDGSIVFSADTKDRVLKSYGRIKSEPAVIHHGMDWGEAERSAPIDHDQLRAYGIRQPYLLYVSQFHRYKNVGRLIRAFAILASRHEDLSLVLVGEASDRGYWRELEREIADLEIKARVIHIPGTPRQDLISIYKGALALVHPSLAETCSFPLLEALALGIPVAAARESALPEMAGPAAIYFDPYNENDIARVLETLILDKPLQDRLKQQAITRALAFSWQKSASATLDVFRSL